MKPLSCKPSKTTNLHLPPLHKQQDLRPRSRYSRQRNIFLYEFDKCSLFFITLSEEPTHRKPKNTVHIYKQALVSLMLCFNVSFFNRCGTYPQGGLITIISHSKRPTFQKTACLRAPPWVGPHWTRPARSLALHSPHDFHSTLELPGEPWSYCEQSPVRRVSQSLCRPRVTFLCGRKGTAGWRSEQSCLERALAGKCQTWVHH